MLNIKVILSTILFVTCHLLCIGQIEFKLGDQATLIMTKRAYLKPSNSKNVFHCILTKQKSDSKYEFFDECLKITIEEGETLINDYATSHKIRMKIHHVEKFKDIFHSEETEEFKTFNCITKHNLNTRNWIYSKDHYGVSAKYMSSKLGKRLSLQVDSIPDFTIRKLRKGLAIDNYTNRFVEFDTGELDEIQIKVVAVEKMIYLYLTEEVNYEYERQKKGLECIYEKELIKTEVVKKGIHFAYNYSDNHIRDFLEVHKEHRKKYTDYDGFSIYQKREFTIKDFRSINVYNANDQKACFLRIKSKKRQKRNRSKLINNDSGITLLHEILFKKVSSL